MANTQTQYEWDLEMMNGEDIADHYFNERLSEAMHDMAWMEEENVVFNLVLVRDVFDSIDGALRDRQWAYIEDGKLPEKFDGGAKVPVRFHAELERLSNTLRPILMKRCTS